MAGIVWRLAGGFQNVMLMGAPSVDGFALNIQFQDCEAPGNSWNFWWMLSCTSSQMDTTHHLLWKHHTLLMHCRDSNEKLCGEFESRHFLCHSDWGGIKLQTWCHRGAHRSQGQNHHTTAGRLDTGTSATLVPGEEKLFGRLKTQVMKPSCRLFGHSQAPSGILEDTSFELVLPQVLHSEKEKESESQQWAFYLWGFSEMKHALYALFLFDPFLLQFVARWLHTTSGKPPGVTSLLVHSTQSPCTLLLLQASPFGFFTKSDALFLSIYNAYIFCGVYRSARHFRCFPWSQHWECTFLTRQPYAYHGPPGCRCANSHIRCVFASNGKTCCESVMLGMWKACLYVCHIVTEVCQVQLWVLWPSKTTT